MNSKGQSLSMLSAGAIAFVFVAVVFVVGLQVLGSVQDGFIDGTAGCNSTSEVSCGYAYNATRGGEESLDELTGWLPTIALVVSAAAVIAVLALFRS